MTVDLTEVPLFSRFSAQELENLKRIARIKRYRKNDMLFEQSDEGQEFFVILQGSIKITVMSEEGRELTLTILRPYQFLGEMALLDDYPRSAAAVALEDTEVLSIHKDAFRTLLERNPQMALPIIRHLGSRLRQLTDDVVGLTFLDVYHRVARKLLSLADQLGIQTEGGTIIPQSLTHQELANLVGTTRETVTKILMEMKKKNILAIEKHHIRILKEAELRRALL